MARAARVEAAVLLDAHTGRAIRTERHRLGWTQQELADACGMSRSWVVSIELGRSGISLYWLLQIGEALDVDPWELTDGAHT